MNGRFQMQGGKNWIFPKEMNANRFFWDSHWLEIWSNHIFPLWDRMEGAWLWTRIPFMIRVLPYLDSQSIGSSMPGVPDPVEHTEHIPRPIVARRPRRAERPPAGRPLVPPLLAGQPRHPRTRPHQPRASVGPLPRGYRLDCQLLSASSGRYCMVETKMPFIIFAKPVTFSCNHNIFTKIVPFLYILMTNVAFFVNNGRKVDIC
jgi:hypothetical protein